MLSKRPPVQDIDLLAPLETVTPRQSLKQNLQCLYYLELLFDIHSL